MTTSTVCSTRTSRRRRSMSFSDTNDNPIFNVKRLKSSAYCTPNTILPATKNWCINNESYPQYNNIDSSIDNTGFIPNDCRSQALFHQHNYNLGHPHHSLLLQSIPLLHYNQLQQSLPNSSANSLPYAPIGLYYTNFSLLSPLGSFTSSLGADPQQPYTEKANKLCPTSSQQQRPQCQVNKSLNVTDSALFYSCGYRSYPFPACSCQTQLNLSTKRKSLLSDHPKDTFQRLCKWSPECRPLHHESMASSPKSWRSNYSVDSCSSGILNDSSPCSLKSSIEPSDEDIPDSYSLSNCTLELPSGQNFCNSLLLQTSSLYDVSVATFLLSLTTLNDLPMYHPNESYALHQPTRWSSVENDVLPRQALFNETSSETYVAPVSVHQPFWNLSASRRHWNRTHDQNSGYCNVFQSSSQAETDHGSWNPQQIPADHPDSQLLCPRSQEPQIFSPNTSTNNLRPKFIASPYFSDTSIKSFEDASRSVSISSCNSAETHITEESHHSSGTFDVWNDTRFADFINNGVYVSEIQTENSALLQENDFRNISLTRERCSTCQQEIFTTICKFNEVCSSNESLTEGAHKIDETDNEVDPKSRHSSKDDLDFESSCQDKLDIPERLHKQHPEAQKYYEACDISVRSKCKNLEVSNQSVNTYPEHYPGNAGLDDINALRHLPRNSCTCTDATDISYDAPIVRTPLDTSHEVASYEISNLEPVVLQQTLVHQEQPFSSISPEQSFNAIDQSSLNFHLLACPHDNSSTVHPYTVATSAVPDWWQLYQQEPVMVPLVGQPMEPIPKRSWFCQKLLCYQFGYFEPYQRSDMKFSHPKTTTTAPRPSKYLTPICLSLANRLGVIPSLTHAGNQSIPLEQATGQWQEQTCVDRNSSMLALRKTDNDITHAFNISSIPVRSHCCYTRESNSPNEIASVYEECFVGETIVKRLFKKDLKFECFYDSMYQNQCDRVLKHALTHHCKEFLYHIRSTFQLLLLWILPLDVDPFEFPNYLTLDAIGILRSYFMALLQKHLYYGTENDISSQSLTKGSLAETLLSIATLTQYDVFLLGIASLLLSCDLAKPLDSVTSAGEQFESRILNGIIGEVHGQVTKRNKVTINNTDAGNTNRVKCKVDMDHTKCYQTVSASVHSRENVKHELSHKISGDLKRSRAIICSVLGWSVLHNELRQWIEIMITRMAILESLEDAVYEGWTELYFKAESYAIARHVVATYLLDFHISTFSIALQCVQSAISVSNRYQTLHLLLNRVLEQLIEIKEMTKVEH